MEKAKTKDNPGVGQTILDDFLEGNIRDNINQDWDELKSFYIDDERKERLEGMNWFKKAFYIPWWLLKELFFKLTPARRFLLVLAVILFVISRNSNSFDHNAAIISIVLIIFVLMLELKDKLVAKIELSEGKSVQEALLPEESPTIPGWDVWLYSRPAHDVGGDLVDYLKIDDSRYGITLADISGKGLGAALLMAKLQATIRAIIQEFDALDLFGKKLNEIFYRDTMRRSFASLVYLELKPGSGTVKLLNAGHMPPVIIRNGLKEKMPKVAPALGLTPVSVFQEQSMDIEEGDMIIIYSDGLSEATDSSGDFFGEERILKHIPKLSNLDSMKIGKSILGDVDFFTGKEQAHDDMSLIVIKRKSSSSD